MLMVKEYWSLLLQITLLWAIRKLLRKIITLTNLVNSSSQIDYILRQHDKFHVVKDIKVILGEEYATQHGLLFCDLSLKINKSAKKA